MLITHLTALVKIARYPAAWNSSRRLQVHGSGTLIRWLLENHLIDQITLLIVPVVLGQGRRLLPDAGPDLALALIDSHVDSKGVTIQVYRPAGCPRYATG